MSTRSFADLVVFLGVGIKWVSSACLACPTCLDGVDGCCLNLKISGYHKPGTFQQFTLAPAGYVTPIPDVFLHLLPLRFSAVVSLPLQLTRRRGRNQETGLL